MSKSLKKEEIWLLHELSLFLTRTAADKEKDFIEADMEKGSVQITESDTHLDWDYILRLAKEHAILSFLYPLVERKEIPLNPARCIRETSIMTVQQNYRLFFLTHYLVTEMQKEQIPVIVLKGVATAGIYSVPELRKSGDIDLLLPISGDMERAIAVLKKVGVSESHGHEVNHHQSWRTKEGIEIEMNTMLAEPFDDKWVNEYLAGLMPVFVGQIVWENIMGLEFPVLPEGYHAFYLLLHMLQHFLRSGFGLKLLCDWVVFWNREMSEQEIECYRSQIRNCGLTGFSDMVTAVCVTYLGLDKRQAEKILFSQYKMSRQQEFMREILEAEEFGQSGQERMVIMRGTKIIDYLREFHHQMRLSFQKSSRYIICWPVLWLLTFIRFCRNNRKIRGVSSFHVLKKARERSRYVGELQLFQKHTPGK